MDFYEAKVLEFNNEYGLFSEKDCILAAVSGGADSVCLLHILNNLQQRIGFSLAVCHVNHGLRGEMADRDEVFTRQLAQELGLPFFCKTVNVKAYAKEKKLSEEAAGRELRYQYFDDLCKENNFTRIATAHHKNDNAETVLMNLLRGSGLKGMCGITARRENIIRPLLCFSRIEIEQYCKVNCLSYMTDATNFEAAYTRNKIRLHTIPYLEKYNPSLVDTLWNSSRLLQEDYDFIEENAEEFLDRCSCRDGGIPIDAIKCCHRAVARRVLISMLQKAKGETDYSFAHIREIENLIQKEKTGMSSDLGGGVQAYIRYGRLFIGQKPETIPPYAYRFDLSCEIVIPEANLVIKGFKTDHDGKNTFTIPDDAELAIRNRRDGDVFYPVGMTGKKKLKDYFIDFIRTFRPQIRSLLRLRCCLQPPHC